MPRISQYNEIDISPEKFLNNCSREELIEVDLLLSKNYYQHKMHGEPASEIALVQLPYKNNKK